MEDQEFAKSREALSDHKRDLVVNNAKGNRPQAARELTEDEKDLLFQQVSLGRTTPKFYSVRCSGCCLRIAGLERETSVEGCSGVIWL